MVTLTTMITKGVDATKKHKIRIAEGRDIRAPVSGAPIEFKRTVTKENEQSVGCYSKYHSVA